MLKISGWFCLFVFRSKPPKRDEKERKRRSPSPKPTKVHIGRLTRNVTKVTTIEPQRLVGVWLDKLVSGSRCTYNVWNNVCEVCDLIRMLLHLLFTNKLSYLLGLCPRDFGPGGILPGDTTGDFLSIVNSLCPLSNRLANRGVTFLSLGSYHGNIFYLREN